VVALPGDDGVQEVAERVRILDGSDLNVALERPQRDLDGVTGGTPVTAGQAITVQSPKLGRAMLLREILGMLHRIHDARPSVAVKRRERLIHIRRHKPTVALSLDRLPAVSQLVRNGSRMVFAA
jgi:hypothetical protein